MIVFGKMDGALDLREGAKPKDDRIPMSHSTMCSNIALPASASASNYVLLSSISGDRPGTVDPTSSLFCTSADI